MKTDRILESFLEKTFSTTEAAAILGMPPETLRTRLKQGWLPIESERKPGEWRRISTTDLLRFRVTSALSDRGLPFPRANQLAYDVQWFRGDVFLYVGLDRKQEITESDFCGVAELGIHLGNSHANTFIVVSLNAECNWLREQIEKQESES